MGGGFLPLAHLGPGMNMRVNSCALYTGLMLWPGTNNLWKEKMAFSITREMLRSWVLGCRSWDPRLGCHWDHYSTDLIIVWSCSHMGNLHERLLWLLLSIKLVKIRQTFRTEWTFEDGRWNSVMALETFCIQKIKVLFHDSWKWTFEQ